MEEHFQESHRPMSRRGIQSNSQEESFSSHRPRTALSTAKPPSRLMTGTPSITSKRIGTTMGYVSSVMGERPITQHGLSGLPTAQSSLGNIGAMRMIKDKRYWQTVLQAKIKEISQENSKLLNERQSLDRERSAWRLYEQRVKDDTKELTDLQAELSSMNIALESFTSGLSRQNLQREATALREKNEAKQIQLESLFSEHQMKDEFRKQLEQEIDSEKNKLNEMILSLTPQEQHEYHELHSLAEMFKNESLEMHNQIENLLRQKERMNAFIMSSPARMEAAGRKSKLRELMVKLLELENEEKNKLTPEQEQDKFIKEVRHNNQALISIAHRIKIAENQLMEKKELLSLLEQSLEEGFSERHAKYRELKRRDETITKFLEAFPAQLELERRNLDILKSKIAYAIEKITLQGAQLRSFEMKGIESVNKKYDLTNQDGLMKEYKKLSTQLKQLQVLEKRTTGQLAKNTEEEQELMREIPKYSNLVVIRTEAAENMHKLVANLEELNKKNRITEDVLEEMKQKNQTLKEHLRSNETYRQISHLEEHLTDLILENKTLQDVVNENIDKKNYSPIRQEVQNFVGLINKLLLEDNLHK